MKTELKLTKEYDYFIDNFDEILLKYENRVIVIVGHAIIGNYDDLESAFNESAETHEPGTFFIKEVTAFSNQPAKFHTRVYI